MAAAADLVVLPSGGRPGVDHVLGSTTERVVRTPVDCPD